MKEKVVVYFPKIGYASGEMPHLRYPPRNYVLPQVLFYLYTGIKNLGHDVIVVDGNFTEDPVTRILEYGPGKILISSTTPSFGDTVNIIRALQRKGYTGGFYVGGSHVSLNLGYRDFLLPKIPGVTYIPCKGIVSGFEWVPRVFPGTSPLNVLGMEEDAAERLLREKAARDNRTKDEKNLMQSCLFKSFIPSTEWIEDTYRGPHVSPGKTEIALRYSILTSIGCSRACSFCSNSYIYSIGYKSLDSIAQILDDPRLDNHLSVSDMFFLMKEKHADGMMALFKEKGYSFSVQTCLYNLTGAHLDNLKKAGIKNILVGIENPLLSSIGKEVEIERVEWLLEETKKRKSGLKLSYIMGLQDTDIHADIELLLHIIVDVMDKYRLPPEHLQVNLYAPYRPEPGITYLPFKAGARYGPATVHILSRLPFRYWGILPIAFYDPEHFRTQVYLCDLLYHLIYTDFKERYLEIRDLFRRETVTAYPVLEDFFPGFDQTVRLYANNFQSFAGERDERPLSPHPSNKGE